MHFGQTSSDVIKDGISTVHFYLIPAVRPTFTALPGVAIGAVILVWLRRVKFRFSGEMLTFREQLAGSLLLGIWYMLIFNYGVRDVVAMLAIALSGALAMSAWLFDNSDRQQESYPPASHHSRHDERLAGPGYGSVGGTRPWPR
jgi:hypothetical protein